MDRHPAAYLRRSASRDPSKEQSREAQETSVRQMARDAADLALYVDWNLSGGKNNRPQYQALRAEIAADRIDKVYAYSMSRLGRSTTELLAFMDLCREHGTKIETEADGRIDSETASGRLLATILAAVMTWEREVRAEQSAAARKIRDELGYERGRYGYRLADVMNGDGKKVRKRVRDASAGDLEAVRQAYTDAGSVLGACRLLKQRGIAPPLGGKRGWSTSALTRVIEREWPELLPRRNARGRRQPTSAIFASLVECPYCGVRLTPNVQRRQYYCRNGAHERASHPRYAITEAALLAFAREQAKAFRPPRAVQMAADANARRDALADRLGRAKELYIAGKIDRARLEREEREVAKEQEAIAAAVAVTELPREIDWSAPPAILGDVLRSLWRVIRMDGDFRPVEAERAVVEWWADA